MHREYAAARCLAWKNPDSECDTFRVEQHHAHLWLCYYVAVREWIYGGLKAATIVYVNQAYMHVYVTGHINALVQSLVIQHFHACASDMRLGF